MVAVLSGIEFLKYLEIIIVSAIKFLFASPVAYLNGFNYIQTVVITSLGGILGVVVFFSLSEGIIKLYTKYFGKLKMPSAVIADENNFQQPKNKKKFIIRIQSRYSFISLIALTPVFFSIPIGSFLANRYFSRRKNTVLLMSLSVVVWAIVLSGLFKIM